MAGRWPFAVQKEISENLPTPWSWIFQPPDQLFVTKAQIYQDTHHPINTQFVLLYVRFWQTLLREAQSLCWAWFFSPMAHRSSCANEGIRSSCPWVVIWKFKCYWTIVAIAVVFQILTTLYGNLLPPKRHHSPGPKVTTGPEIQVFP